MNETKLNQIFGLSNLNSKFSFSLFLVVVLITSIIIIGYISINISLMKLGYHSMELEEQKINLSTQRDQLEYSVENLSSLTRIEKIACQELNMQRAEKIEFIALLPTKKNINLAQVSQESGKEQPYIEAGTIFKQLTDLQIFKNW